MYKQYIVGGYTMWTECLVGRRREGGERDELVGIDLTGVCQNQYNLISLHKIIELECTCRWRHACLDNVHVNTYHETISWPGLAW